MLAYPNLPADPHQITTADFIFAAGVHVLVVLLIIILTWWQPKPAPEPLKRIEVQMISAADLKKMQQPKRRHAQAAKRKPNRQTSLQSKMKKQSKPVEDDFDPFAPLESNSNKEPSPQESNQSIASTFDQQLSTQEKNRYIAMMQAAVQQHWKVPGGISEATPSPLVEMILRRNGRIASVRVIESSGHPTLDQTLINAIHAAAPFQLPKQQFEAFRNNKIRFHPIK